MLNCDCDMLLNFCRYVVRVPAISWKTAVIAINFMLLCFFEICLCT